MRSAITIIALLVVSIADAQVHILENKEMKRKEVTYDSLSNVLPMNCGTKYDYKYTYNHLVGQTLCFCGDPYSNKTNPFKVGEYYNVERFVEKDIMNDIFNDKLILRDEKTGALLEDKDINNYKWVSVGYYKKVSDMYVGKRFEYVTEYNVLIEDPEKKASGLISLDADTVTENIQEGSIWTCIEAGAKPREKKDNIFEDMSDDMRSPIVLIFYNEELGKHYAYIESKDGKPYEQLNDYHKYVCGRFVELPIDKDEEIMENHDTPTYYQHE